MKISKETQVGALTAIAITILVLGYSYLSGKDDLFYSGKTYNVTYTNVDGLTSSNPIMFRGVRIGAVSEVFLDIETLNTHVELEVTKRGFKVPKGTIARLYDTDPLFGAKGIELILGNTGMEAENGDTLIADISQGLMGSLSNSLEPITVRLANVLANLDSITGDGSLERTFKELPETVTALKSTLNSANSLLVSAKPQLNAIFKNVDELTTTLSANRETITSLLENFDKISDELTKAKLSETVASANKALAEFALTMDGINQGKGSLGKLAKDEELYNNLNKASKDLDLLLLDIKNYPDKYIAIPFTKRRQKKAIEESKNGTRTND